MNTKALGEKGQRIVIGELAKLDIDVAIPLSDNLPFDLIVILDGKLMRVQVKSSTQTASGSDGSIEFSLKTSNWYAGTSKQYSRDDVDLMLLCDFEHVYVLEPKQFVGRSSFTIRKTDVRNGQQKGINRHQDFILTRERLLKIQECQ